jgi:hypothetical protein
VRKNWSGYVNRSYSICGAVGVVELRVEIAYWFPFIFFLCLEHVCLSVKHFLLVKMVVILRRIIVWLCSDTEHWTNVRNFSFVFSVRLLVVDRMLSLLRYDVCWSVVACDFRSGGLFVRRLNFVQVIASYSCVDGPSHVQLTLQVDPTTLHKVSNHCSVYSVKYTPYRDTSQEL